MEIELSRLIDALPGLVWTTTAGGATTFLNERWRRYTGVDADGMDPMGWRSAIHPDDRLRANLCWDACLASGQPGEVEARLRRSDGEFRWFQIRTAPITDSAGKVAGWCGISTEIEDRVQAEATVRQQHQRFERVMDGDLKQAEATLAAEKRLLELVAQGVALPDALDTLCRQVESLVPGALCSILIVDPEQQRFWLGAAPSLPRTYTSALEGVPVAPGTGPCGLAVTQKKPAISGDLANDARWVSPTLAALLAEHGLAACWSAPILSAGGEALGAFATYRKTPAVPPPAELELVDRFAKIAGIAIARARSEAALTQSEARLRRANRYLVSAQRLSKTGSYARDVVTDAQDVSEEMFRIWQFDPHAPVTHDMVRARIHPEDRAAFDAVQAAAAEAGKDIDLTYRIVLPGGEIKHLHTVSYVHAETPNRIIVGATQDITDTKLAEEALRTSETDLRRAYELLTEGERLSHTSTFLWDVEADVHDWSKEAYNIWEFDPGTKITMPLILGTLHPDDVGPAEALIGAAFTGSPGFDFSFRIRTTSGALKHLHVVGRRVAEIPDRPVFMGALQDVTQSKLVEEALRQANRYLTEAQRLSRTGSFTWDMTHDVQRWSDELYRIWEFEPGSNVTLDMVLGAVHPEDLPAVQAALAPTAEGGDFDAAFRIVTPSGSVKHLHTVGHRLREPADQFIYLGASQDVTEAKLAEEALTRREADLRRANRYLTGANHLSKTGAFTWDVGKDEQHWTEELYRLWEFDPDDGQTIERVMAAVVPEDVPAIEAALSKAFETGGDYDISFRIVTRSGALKHFHTVGKRDPEITDRLVYMGFSQDVTAAKLAEEALNRARGDLAHMSRVMALNTLTASIAHEVNQPLSGVITNASTGLRMLAADPPNISGARTTLQRALRDGNRASEVIKKLRGMFTRQAPAAETVDLNDAAREVLALSAAELQRRRIALHTHFDDSLATVGGDRVQLQQVILNLVLNAADAMKDTSDGPRDLRVETSRGADGEIQLAVRDSGVGFDAETADRLFDPFYTTKSEGMGIGLAISRSIVEAHEGRLWARPNDGPGATFAFSIPCNPCSDSSPLTPQPREAYGGQ